MYASINGYIDGSDTHDRSCTISRYLYSLRGNRDTYHEQLHHAWNLHIFHAYRSRAFMPSRSPGAWASSSSSCNHKLHDTPSTQDCQISHKKYKQRKYTYIYIFYTKLHFYRKIHCFDADTHPDDSSSMHLNTIYISIYTHHKQVTSYIDVAVIRYVKKIPCVDT